MKVNVGSSSFKKSLFPISFDSSTSINFGEVVPNFCYEAVSDSNVSVDLRAACRFGPLSLPTFGKAYLHTYAFSYKIQDLYPPFNNLLSGTPFSGTAKTYVPSSVPSINLSLLWLVTLCHSSFSVYKVETSSVINPASSPLKLGSYSVSPVDVSSFAPYPAAGLVATLSSSMNLGLSSVSSFLTYLKRSDRLDNIVYGLNSSAPCTYIPSTSSVDSISSDAITPSGSDFMLVVKGSDIYSSFNNVFSAASPAPDGNYLYCFKLNNSGKFLRKIFLGLGYQIINSKKLVSFLPLVAYHRAYFDTFAPKRFIKYDQTSFSRFINGLVQHGVTVTSLLLSSGTFAVPFSGIVDELLSCYYTQDTDFYSSQILGLVNDYGGDVSQPYIGVINNTTDNDVLSNEIVESNVQLGAPPALDLSNGLLHTQSQQNILSRLTQFVNRRSILGGKIADLLQSVFGIPKSEVYDNENPLIGTDVIEIQFSDVFSTAETSEASLGEYAGKALGFGSTDKLNVHCKVPCYVFTFSVVVPRTQRVQGVNPLLFHCQRSDFYNPMFDGVTLLPSDRLSLYAVDSINDPIPDSDDSFGNQSLYSEYKMKSQGVLNGDLSLLSTKSTYDSFTMDQVIANYVYTSHIPESGHPLLGFELVSPDHHNLAAGTMWRYVGRWLWLGNFDRIFINQRLSYFGVPSVNNDYDISSRDVNISDDNLILHSVVDLKVNSPMLPEADSYLTRDLCELDSHSGSYAQSE